VSVGALVQHVGALLGRAHALFGDPPQSGGSAASAAGWNLAAAGDLVRSGQGEISGLSGRFATNYGVFASDTGPALDGLAGTDERLSTQLHEAAGSDRSGRAASGTLVNGAAADTAALAPFSNLPAGEKALLTALRARVAQQQKVVQAYQVRDARMAALLRSMAYAGRAGGAGGGLGTPLGGGGFGGASPAGRGGGGAPWSLQGQSALSRLAGGNHNPHTALATRGEDRRASAVSAGPGGVAVRAALSKQGIPYLWGAKGPDRFDCSGLTQWAWRQAGVQLGGDTYTQIKQGITVPPGEVRAGDLIFPKYSFDGRGPGHVQLAISPAEVIHAPQTGDVVRVAPMPSAYVARRPVPLD
jgi:cell wall-associated NlpC family hydrolase